MLGRPWPHMPASNLRNGLARGEVCAKSRETGACLPAETQGKSLYSCVGPRAALSGCLIHRNAILSRDGLKARCDMSKFMQIRFPPWEIYRRLNRRLSAGLACL